MQHPPIDEQITFLYTRDLTQSTAFYEDIGCVSEIWRTLQSIHFARFLKAPWQFLPERLWVSNNDLAKTAAYNDVCFGPDKVLPEN